VCRRRRPKRNAGRPSPFPRRSPILPPRGLSETGGHAGRTEKLWRRCSPRKTAGGLSLRVDQCKAEAPKLSSAVPSVLQAGSETVIGIKAKRSDEPDITIIILVRSDGAILPLWPVTIDGCGHMFADTFEPALVEVIVRAMSSTNADNPR
jgi:hypothetical protein